MQRCAASQTRTGPTISRLVLTHPDPAGSEAEDLLQRLQSETDPDVIQRLRDRIAVLNLGLVESIASRYRGRGLEWEDLVQVGRLALCKAVIGYRPGRGSSFSAYATPTIAGEIKRHFRDHAWGVRPPRRLQELQREMRSCEEELGQVLAREPSRKELAEALHVGADAVDQAHLAQHLSATISLDAPSTHSATRSLADRLPADDDAFDLIDMREPLRPAMKPLDVRERRIVYLRFVGGYTQEQIGHELGISQMQVSRLLSTILTKLRADLTSPARAS
jgi:RNA polymerase sigma-B factor